MSIQLGPAPEDFIWAGGIEDSFVPQTRPGHRALDEYELIGHYEHWRGDLALARDLGLRALRWGIPWYRVEPVPGKFDWRWTDEVLPYMVEELGITPILDLVHYGCPFWLRREFAADEYPQAVAHYAAAVAARYGKLIRWYTPLNEPLINALMCGSRGLWPPYLRGERGYIRVMIQLVKGIAATVRAIRAVVPDARMVYVEAAGLTRAARPELLAVAREEQERRDLSFDLLTGRVTPQHTLFTWLVRHGVTLNDLADLGAAPLELDIIGVNFYPQWSTNEVYTDARGGLASRIIERGGTGFAELITAYYRRYRVPIIVTETSARGSDAVRDAWLRTGLAAIKQMREGGIPVLGYTWFPLFTMIDWRYRFGRAPVEDYHLQLGLYRLLTSAAGPRWAPTLLTAAMRAAIANPGAAIGTLARPAG
ncbi:MAG TPA: family 1 glycosylhydrolase [Chloroflexia bacterium]|nr:family 1 glycosylhydrolase [Chloroflexia bacterium]